MTETLSCSLALRRWSGERGTYHLVSITGEAAETIAMHERLRRLEYGARRGFGSVKVLARIGATRWNSSVFPQDGGAGWMLLVGKKVMRAEDLAEGDAVRLELELL